MQHKQTGMSLKQYMLVFLLSSLLVLCLLCPAAQADDGMGEAVDLSALVGDHTLTDGTYHLTGSTAHSLTIGGVVTLWMDNASILTAGEAPALVVTDSAELTIRLVGENKLSASGEEQAGLSISTGAQVTIGTSEDTGCLAVTGGAWANGVSGTGTLTIAGGTVHATGGDEASGIGASVVRVTGGVVQANGGYGSAGIGGGNKEVGGVIEITGGTVMAQGGAYAPGIGSGARASAETPVYIRGGSVRSIGGENAKRDIDPVKETATATEASVLVKLTGWQAGEPAGFVRTSAGTYGTEGMQADADGAFYLWLPESVAVKRMQVGEKTYLFSLTAGGSGTYVYSTTDTVLDVSEGQVTITGKETAYTITGTQTATDECIVLNGTVVTFYNLKASSPVKVTGEASIHLVGENQLSGTTETPLQIAVESTCALTGERLSVISTNAPAVQAAGATLQIGTAETVASVILDSRGAHSALTATGGILTMVNGTLEANTSGGDATISVKDLLVKGGTLRVTAPSTGIGAAVSLLQVENGTARMTGRVGVVALECKVTGGHLEAIGAEAGISASTGSISGGSVHATSDGSGAAIGSQSGAGACSIAITGGTVNALANGTGAAIGSGEGAATCRVVITGSSVVATAKGGGAAIGGGASVAGGEIVIHSGAVIATAEGGGAAIGGGKNGAAGVVTIMGGSIFCKVQGTEAGNAVGGGVGQQAVAPKNESGAALLATYVTGIARDLPVTKLTTQLGASYGTGFSPDENGTICVWIPAGDAVISVENADKVHTGKVLAGTSGKCAASAVSIPLETEFVITSHSYQMGETIVEHTGEYLLTGTGAAKVLVRGATTTITLRDVDFTGETYFISVVEGGHLTLRLEGESRMAIHSDAGSCIALTAGCTLTIENGSTRGSLTLVGGAKNGYAIADAGAILQKSGTVICVDGTESGVAHADLTYTMTGGSLLVVDGASTAAPFGKLTVNGGMVKLPTDHKMTVQNGAGKALLPIWVNGLPANAPVTACSLSDYGITDLYTDENGALCLWATPDTALTSVTVGATVYKCSIPAGSEGVARKYYAITFYEDADGNRVVADVTEAYEGQTVTLTVIPGENRKPAGVPAVVLDGVSYPTMQQGDGYTFAMPLGAVSLTCSFQPIVITIPEGETQTLTELSIDADQTLIVLGTLIMDGELENVGVIEVGTTGRLEMRGVLTNHGVITNKGEMVLAAEATLENAGTVTSEGIFENNGKLMAHFGSTFKSEGDYLGDGVIDGEGKIIGVGLPTWAILLIVLGGVLVVALIGFAIWKKVKQTTPQHKPGEQETM